MNLDNTTLSGKGQTWRATYFLISFIWNAKAGRQKADSFSLFLKCSRSSGSAGLLSVGSPSHLSEHSCFKCSTYFLTKHLSPQYLSLLMIIPIELLTTVTHFWYHCFWIYSSSLHFLMIFGTSCSVLMEHSF